MLSNDETGTTHVISFWESKEVAERKPGSAAEVARPDHLHGGCRRAGDGGVRRRLRPPAARPGRRAARLRGSRRAPRRAPSAALRRLSRDGGASRPLPPARDPRRARIILAGIVLIEVVQARTGILIWIFVAIFLALALNPAVESLQRRVLRGARKMATKIPIRIPFAAWTTSIRTIQARMIPSTTRIARGRKRTRRSSIPAEPTERRGRRSARGRRSLESGRAACRNELRWAKATSFALPVSCTCDTHRGGDAVGQLQPPPPGFARRPRLLSQNEITYIMPCILVAEHDGAPRTPRGRGATRPSSRPPWSRARPCPRRSPASSSSMRAEERVEEMEPL